MSIKNEDSGTKKCPFCAETMNIETIKCCYCHSDLSYIKVIRKIELKRDTLESKIQPIENSKITKKSFLKSNNLKIVLINPPYQYISPKSNNINYNRPPLGILYIAAYIESKLNIKVDILDAYAKNMAIDEVTEVLTSNAYNIIGFSVTTPTYDFVKNISAQLKKHSPDIFLIAGGPHVTLFPDSLLEHVDCTVLGEGEVTFYEVIKYLLGDSKNHKIDGTILRINNNIFRNPLRKFQDKLDDFPFPDRTKITENSYGHIFSYGIKHKKFTTLITSRGCSYNCFFCANRALWGKDVRRRSIGNVLEEIKLLLAQDYQLIFFDDDDLIEDRNYLTLLCKTIIEEKIKFKWICHAKIAQYKQELLSLMSKAGCIEVQIGVESFNQNALDAVNKKIKSAHIHECIRNFQNHKMNVWATIIIGLPTDSKDSFKETVQQLLKANPFYATFIMLFPFPGIKIYKTYKEKGFIIHEDFSNYSWHQEPVFFTDKLSFQDLIDLRKYAYRKFYLRPVSIIKYIFYAIKYSAYRDILLNFIRFIHLKNFSVKQTKAI
jgi:anaerobic magnesium-protoporphyrin IX monomethyl ester cyclase